MLDDGATDSAQPYDQPQRVMAFDFGSQKMGVAFGQALLGTASPLPLLLMKDGIPSWEQLLKLIQDWQPEACLVGLPLNMDDSESELSRRARKFARRLRHQTNLPVWMVDERLSTRDARERVTQISQTRRGKLPSADAMAAVLLAETWFRDPQGIVP